MVNLKMSNGKSTQVLGVNCSHSIIRIHPYDLCGHVYMGSTSSDRKYTVYVGHAILILIALFRELYHSPNSNLLFTMV